MNFAPRPSPLARDRNSAAVQLGQLLRHHEPEPEPAFLARAIGTLDEELENFRQSFAGDPDAVV